MIKIIIYVISITFIYSQSFSDIMDEKPLWTFIGLEDARMVQWSNKYFLCGVRRDTTTLIPFCGIKHSWPRSEKPVVR